MDYVKYVQTKAKRRAGQLRLVHFIRQFGNWREIDPVDIDAGDAQTQLRGIDAHLSQFQAVLLFELFDDASVLLLGIFLLLVMLRGRTSRTARGELKDGRWG